MSARIEMSLVKSLKIACQSLFVNRSLFICSDEMNNVPMPKFQQILSKKITSFSVIGEHSICIKAGIVGDRKKERNILFFKGGKDRVVARYSLSGNNNNTINFSVQK